MPSASSLDGVGTALPPEMRTLAWSNQCRLGGPRGPHWREHCPLPSESPGQVLGQSPAPVPCPSTAAPRGMRPSVAALSQPSPRGQHAGGFLE